jgi:anthranilate phosphoribosyltransferase
MARSTQRKTAKFRHEFLPVVLNAAAALLIGNCVDKLSEGIELARNNKRNGNAQATLHGLIRKCGDEEKLLAFEPTLRNRH